MIEGVAALGVAFLLLTLLVQVGAVMAAREAAQGAAAAAARRAARPAADLGAERDRLVDLLASTVPGADEVTASVSLTATEAVASAAFRWTPPGPDWMPIRIHVDARVSLVVPP